ncbi:MAG TPA: hypothetical protein VEW46_06575 [Pyrinomonadaceae bacterium]|nr:hypothetical protein [Pyrinomonadaceae bacterium]
MSYSYAIAGRSLCIKASDEWAASLIQDFLRDFHLEPTNDVTNPDYTISISSQALPPSVPQGLDTFEVAHGHCSTDGQHYYLALNDSLIIVDPDRSMHIWVNDTPRARQPLARINLMVYTLEISLRRLGLYQLHGAGLAPPGMNAAALILGSSGSGKSTLTALLASQGWSYMTDDALLLSDEGGVINARGIRTFFAASEATLESCSLQRLTAAMGSTMLTDSKKRRLDPTVAFPDSFISSCMPRVLFFASISGKAASEIIPITQAETMSRLIRSNPWTSYDSFTARDHLRVLNRLATQCSAYSFCAGRDVLDDPSLAQDLFLPLLKEAANRAAKTHPV